MQIQLQILSWKWSRSKDRQSGKRKKYFFLIDERKTLVKSSSQVVLLWNRIPYQN